MKKNIVLIFEELINCRKMSESSTDRELFDEEIEKNCEYGSIKNLTMKKGTDDFPSRIYFQNGKFLILYLDQSNELLYEFSAEELFIHLGNPLHKLKSHTEDLEINVYTDLGISFAAKDNRVLYIEIFTPMSINEYKENFYTE